jgi:hypothetical protein
MRLAVDELKDLIRERYPDATFRIARDPDIANGVNIWTAVDLEDTSEVLDFIMDKLLQLQIDDGLPVLVVPVHTPERSARIAADEKKRRAAVLPGAH